MRNCLPIERKPIDQISHFLKTSSYGIDPYELYLTCSVFVFYFKYLVIWIFDHLNIAMLTLVVLNVMPMTNRSIQPYHHISTS